jgi:hypothetical protein
MKFDEYWTDFRAGVATGAVVSLLLCFTIYKIRFFLLADKAITVEVK